MLVLSRKIGESVIVEDVRVMVVSIEPTVEVVLQKVAGGEEVRAVLPHDQYVDACYDTQLIHIESRSEKVRLGIEAPEGIRVHREEVGF